ncbi:MAG: EamA family transporter [Actinobacteria bacterium]|nr:EamA family transporter [Actinomycetota bacterium]
MLLGTILLWALNVTATRYALTHGFRPLAYATIRYFAATGLFFVFTWQRERSFRIARSDAKQVALAALLVFLNQLCFVSALHLATASTVGLVLGTTPVLVGVFALLGGIERPSRRFWLAAAVSFGGVGLIGAGSQGGVSGDLVGDLLAFGTAATWAGYSVAIAPLMRRYSAFRVSALVLVVGWVPLALVSIPELARQSFHFSGLTWLAFVYAVIGPLFLTNILWFTAIDRVGPSRASLFANLQPFFAVLFALLLLSEHLNGWEIAGGAAIAVGIALERVHKTPPVPVE